MTDMTRNANNPETAEQIDPADKNTAPDFTELIFIIDRSGSMGPLSGDTIGGFNTLVENQKKENGRCLINTVLFNQDISILHDRIDINAVEPLTRKDYVAYGPTALLDAIGDTLVRVNNIRRYLRREDIPSHTLVVITTDGMENASHRYTQKEIKSMIESFRTESGWDFLFIGSNIDSISTAGGLGIPPCYSVNYSSSSRGVKIMYDTVTDTVSAFRKEQAVPESWKDKLEDDNKHKKGIVYD